MTTFKLIKAKVHNRGRPPTAFLDELIAWGRDAPAEIFLPNDRADAYLRVAPKLGPWNGPQHRRAAMLEVLRVLAGFESSWNWEEGRDMAKPTPNTLSNEESGIFQCSYDSTGIDPSLRQLLIAHAGVDLPQAFIERTKADHAFALEYCARLLRFTAKHHGPLKGGSMLPWVSREAVAEFRELLG